MSNKEILDILGVSEKEMQDSKDRYSIGNSSCPFCKGKGYIFNDDNKVTTCTCQKTKYFHNKFEESGISKSYWDMSMNEWNVQQDYWGNELGNRKRQKMFVYNFINKYIELLPKVCQGIKIPIKKQDEITKEKYFSLLIHGGNNSGKTMLSSIIMQESVKDGRTVRYYDWVVDIIPALVNFNKSDILDEIVESFKNCDIVCIDGVRYYEQLNSNHVVYSLDRICYARLNSNRPIIITCDNEFIDKKNDLKSSGWNQLFKTCFQVPLP